MNASSQIIRGPVRTPTYNHCYAIRERERRPERMPEAGFHSACLVRNRRRDGMTQTGPNVPAAGADGQDIKSL